MEIAHLGHFPGVRAMAENYASEFLGAPNFAVRPPSDGTRVGLAEHFRLARQVGEEVLCRVLALFPDEGHGMDSTRKKCQRALDDKINRAEAVALSAIEVQQAPRPMARQSPSRLKAVTKRR